MTSVFVAWGVSAIVMCFLGIALGAKAIERGRLGILLDERGRFSLSRAQLTVWTVVVLSLAFGVFWGRVSSDPSAALEFSIPTEVLGVLGISLGSTVLATTIKTGKDRSSKQSPNVAASYVDPSTGRGDKPRLSQMFLVEEGVQADKIIDIAKFQNFCLTVILVFAYVVLAATSLGDAASPDKITALPGFAQEFVVLLAISHAGYVVGKVPDKAGEPEGLTLALLQQGATPVDEPEATTVGPKTYIPRNPAHPNQP